MEIKIELDDVEVQKIIEKVSGKRKNEDKYEKRLNKRIEQYIGRNTLNDVTQCFVDAIRDGRTHFIAVAISRDGEFPELIINTHIQFTDKLKYYSKAYNEDLTLKSDNKVRIVGITRANSFNELKELYWSCK